MQFLKFTTNDVVFLVFTSVYQSHELFQIWAVFFSFLQWLNADYIKKMFLKEIRNTLLTGLVRH